MLRALLFSLLSLSTSLVFAADRVTGDASRAMDGLSKTCATVQDTAFGGSAYILYAPEFNLDQNNFSLAVLMKGLRCESQDNKFSWREVSVTAPIDYSIDGLNGMLRVHSWLDHAELILTDSDLNLITTKAIEGRSIEEKVSMVAPLEKMLSASELRNWQQNGLAKFRLQITLRGVGFYTVNGSAPTNRGLMTGGTFILQGEIRHTSQGNIFSLRE